VHLGAAGNLDCTATCCYFCSPGTSNRKFSRFARQNDQNPKSFATNLLILITRQT